MAFISKLRVYSIWYVFIEQKVLVNVWDIKSNEKKKKPIQPNGKNQFSRIVFY